MLSLQMFSQLQDRHPVLTPLIVSLLTASLISVTPVFTYAASDPLERELRALQRSLEKIGSTATSCQDIEEQKAALEKARDDLEDTVAKSRDRREEISDDIDDLKKSMAATFRSSANSESVRADLRKKLVDMIAELKALTAAEEAAHKAAKQAARDFEKSKQNFRKLARDLGIEDELDCLDDLDVDLTSLESGSHTYGGYRSEVTDPCLVWIEHQKGMDKWKFWVGNGLAGLLGGAGIFLAFKAEKDAAKDLKEQRKFAQQQYNDALQNGGLRMFSRNGAGFPGGIPPIFGPSSAVIGAAAAGPLNATLGPVMGALGAINGSGPINLNIGAGAGATTSGSTTAAGSASAGGSLGGMSELELLVAVQAAQDNPAIRERMMFALLNDTSMDAETRYTIYQALNQSGSSVRIEGGNPKAWLDDFKKSLGTMKGGIKDLRDRAGEMRVVMEDWRTQMKEVTSTANFIRNLDDSLAALEDNLNGLENQSRQGRSRFSRDSRTSYRRSERGVTSRSSRL
ncbi:MAG: hypothetical protein HY391_01025 [Deltaproteobacteria bacterium]|nr:hypothetical protein [Deltaproteobacteria bacterium]